MGPTVILDKSALQALFRKKLERISQEGFPTGRDGGGEWI